MCREVIGVEDVGMDWMLLCAVCTMEEYPTCLSNAVIWNVGEMRPLSWTCPQCFLRPSQIKAREVALQEEYASQLETMILILSNDVERNPGPPNR